jgi:hypothetical protein
MNATRRRECRHTTGRVRSDPERRGAAFCWHSKETAVVMTMITVIPAAVHSAFW